MRIPQKPHMACAHQLHAQEASNCYTQSYNHNLLKSIPNCLPGLRFRLCYSVYTNLIKTRVLLLLAVWNLQCVRSSAGCHMDQMAPRKFNLKSHEVANNDNYKWSKQLYSNTPGTPKDILFHPLSYKNIYLTHINLLVITKSFNFRILN